MPRRSTPLNAAKKITNVLQKMKDVPYERIDFMKIYIEKSTAENSPKYSTEIAKCLKNNNCFTKSGTQIVLSTIPPLDVLKLSVEAALKTRKGAHKTPQLKYSVNNSLTSEINDSAKLIPIANNVKKIIEKIGIENIINSLRNDFGMEIIAKQIIVKEY